MKTGAWWMVGWGLWLSSALALAEQEPLTVYFLERPPFMMRTNDGGVSGSLATAATQIFAKAEVAYQVREASPERQLRELKTNTRRVCSLGWFTTAERRKFAKFSKPLAQDATVVGVAHPDFRPEPGATAAVVLAKPEVRVLVKDNTVQGPYLQAQFGSMRAKVVRTAAEFPQMLVMLRSGRADILFMPQDEAEYYAKHAGYGEGDFNIIHFPDMPPGEYRHLMCSMKVEDATLAKLNAALGGK
jgi:polar amino acid transport system substrate-binding protein